MSCVAKKDILGKCFLSGKMFYLTWQGSFTLMDKHKWEDGKKGSFDSLNVSLMPSDTFFFISEVGVQLCCYVTMSPEIVISLRLQVMQSATCGLLNKLGAGGCILITSVCRQWRWFGAGWQQLCPQFCCWCWNLFTDASLQYALHTETWQIWLVPDKMNEETVKLWVNVFSKIFSYYIITTKSQWHAHCWS